MPEYSSAAQALEALAASAGPQQLGETNAVVVFDLSGEEGGQWTATIADGQLNITEGVSASSQVTFKMQAADFVALVNGTMNPIAAFMQGRIKVEGDMGVAMKLQTLFT